MRQAVLTVVLLATVFAGLPRAVLACGPYYTDEQLSDNLDEVRRKVELLLSGTDQERMAISGLVHPHFKPFFQEIPPEEREAAREIVETLRGFLSSEGDDWILSRLLRGLHRSNNKLLKVLFRDALEHPSSNVRWRAVQYFVSHRDPRATESLERAWSAEERPWIRLDLALALTCQESTVHVEELLDHAESEHPLLQEAAALGLGRLNVEGAAESLARLARNGDPPARVAALNALGLSPPTEATRELLFEAGDDESRDVRFAALRGLARHPDAEIVDLLVDRAVRSRAGEDRWLAGAALNHVPPPLLAAALERARPLLDHSDDEQLQAFRNLEGGQVLARRHQGGLRNDDPSACDLEPLNGDPSVPLSLIVAALPPRTTVRCWQAPGIPGGPLYSFRPATGAELKLQDLFDAADRRWWFAYVKAVHAGCWIPESEVAEEGSILPGNASFAGAPPGDRIEFDLSATELSGAAARSLSAAGLLKIIEPGAEMTGVVLSTELITEEKLARLVAAYGDGTGFLDIYVAQALLAVRPRFPRHAGLEPLLARIAKEPPDPVTAFVFDESR